MPVKELHDDILKILERIKKELKSYERDYPNAQHPEKAELMERLEGILDRTQKAWKRFGASTGDEELFGKTFTSIKRAAEIVNKDFIKWQRSIKKAAKAPAASSKASSSSSSSSSTSSTMTSSVPDGKSTFQAGTLTARYLEEQAIITSFHGSLKQIGELLQEAEKVKNTNPLKWYVLNEQACDIHVKLSAKFIEENPFETFRYFNLEIQQVTSQIAKYIDLLPYEQGVPDQGSPKKTGGQGPALVTNTALAKFKALKQEYDTQIAVIEQQIQSTDTPGDELLKKHRQICIQALDRVGAHMEANPAQKTACFKYGAQLNNKLSTNYERCGKYEEAIIATLVTKQFLAGYCLSTHPMMEKQEKRLLDLQASHKASQGESAEQLKTTSCTK